MTGNTQGGIVMVVTQIRLAPQPAVVTAALPSAIRRRVAVTVVLAPLTWLGLTSAGGGLTYAPLFWLVVVGVASVLGAASLSTYVPGPGPVVPRSGAADRVPSSPPLRCPSRR